MTASNDPQHHRDGSPTAELVRLGEGAIATQIQLFTLHQSQARHLLTLASGVLVVAVAMAGFVGGRAMGPFFGFLDFGLHGFLTILLISFIASFAATVCFAFAYVGSRNRPMTLQPGWDPARLIQAALDGDTIEEVRESTLWGMKRWFQHNQDLLDHMGNLLRFGMWSLSTGGTTLAVALIYALEAS